MVVDRKFDVRLEVYIHMAWFLTIEPACSWGKDPATKSDEFLEKCQRGGEGVIFNVNTAYTVDTVDFFDTVDTVKGVDTVESVTLLTLLTLFA